MYTNTSPLSHRHFFKMTAIASVLLAGSIPLSVMAETTAVQSYNIPAQPLDNALTQLADDANLKLLYQADVVNQLKSQPLSGSYTPQQALEIMLQGTGLKFRSTDPGGITIEKDADSKAPTSQKTDPKTVTLKPTIISGERRYASTAPYNPDYNLPNASTATKTDTPIMETPISIQVVPRAVMQDQQSIQLGDATKNVSGVFQGTTFGGFAEQFMIRGFNTNYANYYDGFRFPASRLSLANAERVEVVKGAAANLYGRIEPGGMINVVTKRPQATPYYALEQQFGSYDLYRTTADATGAINKDGSLMYRLNLEYLNKNSFRDYGFTERIFVAPSLTWQVSDRTRIDLDFMHSDEDTREDYGVPSNSLTRRPVDIPISRYLGEPSTDKSNTKLYNTGVTLSHAFTDDWKVRAKFNYLKRDIVDPQTFPIPFPFAFNAQTGQLGRNYYNGTGSLDSYFGTVDVTGKFSTWGVKHNVLAGWDNYNASSALQNYFYGANAINIYNPQYNPIDVSPLQQNDFADTDMQWNGVYFQDQITLFDKLHILGGGRYDWAAADAGYSGQSLALATASRTGLQNERFNPRVGLLYQPWQWLSLYGNYVESMGTANTAIGVEGNILQPETAEQYEAGFKTSFFDERLTSTVAFYSLTKQNMVVPIAGSIFSESIGKARSQGMEVDIAGRITEGLSLIASYAYTDATVLKGNNEGKRLWNVPRNAGSLWAKYDLQQEAVRGLSIGAGVYFQGQKEGDIGNTFELPGYGRVDALVKYKLPVAKAKTTLQFNVENLLDRQYYAASIPFNNHAINPGAPRTFMGSVKVEF